MNHKFDQSLAKWAEDIETAESIVSLIKQLFRKKNVMILILNKSLVNCSAISIIEAHYSIEDSQHSELSISIKETFSLLKEIAVLDLNSISIDIMQLASQLKMDVSGSTRSTFFKNYLLAANYQKLKDIPSSSSDVVIYGFGRIGRLLTRILIQEARPNYGLHLKAIVIRKNSGKSNLIKRINLLRRDSVHGPFPANVELSSDLSSFNINGNTIEVIESSDPGKIDYTKFGITDSLMIDSTGKWRDLEGLNQHLACPGISRVILTAPGKGGIKNVVQGVNHHNLSITDKIISASSCTTNAIVPVLKIVNDGLRIEHGHIETVHSYTNDQSLIDGFHSSNRRGRSAALNMVLTETGAATAATKVLPELSGRLTGNAIRVPTPNVSMAILSLTLGKSVNRTQLNQFIHAASLSHLCKQLGFINEEDIVSSDFIGSEYAGVVDGSATICNNKQAILYVWYDNEFGYSNQVIRLAKSIASSQV